MIVSRIGAAAALVATCVFFQSAAPAGAALFNQELKCSASLAKSFSKLQSSIAKVRARCHDSDISGKSDSANGCETLDSKSEAKIDKAKTKFVSKVAKACQSACSISNDVACVSDLSCPARHQAAPPNNSIAERCLGKGGANPFSLRNLDWPGPYCDSILGHAMREPEDLGECLIEIVGTTADAIDAAVYGGVDETAGLDKTGAKCISKIAKATAKATQKAYLATAKCRDARRSENDSNNPPWTCAATDADAVAAIQKELDKLSDAVDKACDDSHIAIASAAGGLCAPGGAQPTTVAEAQACLGDLVRELATEERGYNRHVYSPLGMLNVTHPDSAAAYCGDGVVTATREEHTGVGEECDGESDSACPGECLPPGDVFECTCPNTPRERFIVNGSIDLTDSDAGWLGASHDATHNDGFGYVSELSNCTCDAFSSATCTSPSGDDVCDVRANMAPRCSDDIDGTQTCDERGNGNGIPENADCFRCDDYSINAGDWCANGTNADETACQSQCIVDATGLPVAPETPCDNQDDCAEGQTCRGRCDNTVTCNKMTDGSPLPLISAANPVCVMLEYKTDVVGTKNIVTGETAIDYNARSLISLGDILSENFAEPCPVCNGTCLGGAEDGEPCHGRCDVSNDPCLFDTDCTAPGDTACVGTDDECPGGACALDLRCSTGLHEGRLCRPDAFTPFGTVSPDCPPIPTEAISGSGVQQNYGTFTTETVEFPAGAPCTHTAWGNYDCPCPANVPPNTGMPTRPNACAAACDGGPNVGKGCVTGTGGGGIYTTCVGGVENGLPCDDNADCDSGNCGGNPLECTAGDLALLGTTCSTNGDCGGGGLCEDSCPGARCVPLCLQEGRCNGGARDGDVCSTLDHCKECTAGNPLLIGTPCDTNARCNTTIVSGDGVCEPAGGVTCDLHDPEDGVCAAGPFKMRCNGDGFTTIPCTLEYGTCTMGLCTGGSPSLRNTACSVNTDCVENENVPVSSGCETGIDALPGTADDIPGAGECEPRPEDCFYANGFAEGGDTLNGEGSPTDVNINAAFCTPPNSNSAVNSASGFGGPSRVRRQGIAIVNVPSIP